MDNEQRNRDRTPNFEIVDLVVERGGTEEVHSIMLRDESPRGLGGVFIGHEPPNPENACFLQGPDGSRTPTRIVWVRKVADHVTLIGMEQVAR